MASPSLTFAFFLSLINFPCLINAQQRYAADICTVNDSSSSILGYNCSGVNTTCESFLIYRAQPSYNTISSIASLLSANASQMSEINNISENVTMQTNNEVIVPVTCSCADRFHQVNTSYVVQNNDSYYLIANNTFEGLTTCNAIRTQKVSPNIENIYPNERLTIPLRCACPTRSQVNDGVRYLMSFVIERGDSVASIAINFEADVGQTFEANGFSEDDNVIQPFTTLLVPLRNPPTTTILVPSQNPPNGSLNNTENGRSSTHIAVAISVPIVVAILVLFGVGFCIYYHKGKKPSQDTEEFIEAESLKFDFKVIRTATDDFSQRNKLGQGGFGGVYKGKLQNGQEVAVKRLSTNSGQGIEEFKTEVLLLEKLQHNNLVKLLGYCVHGEEKLLVYELLPNSSLDKVLLDRIRQPSLGWETRYNILLGTARGLLYLHEDSRLKIIHRDLKMSNILLDENMNAKIADFGLARLVGRDQIQADTSKIDGTYGYMAPEYALTGRFSIMSDVYSFGVIALEIVSGRMCSSTTFPYEDESLCQRAWRLWKDDAILDLVDPRLNGIFLSDEVTRCIHIGLLCIQENANKRPMMAVIVSALNGHHVVLPEPEPPQLGPPTIIQYRPESSIKFAKNNDDFTDIHPR